jgi:ABC-type transport system substrate-binding protein
MFYRFIDARDAHPGAPVTAKDVEAAINYAEEKLIAQYGLDNNGLSKAEINVCRPPDRNPARAKKMAPTYSETREMLTSRNC